MTALSVRLGARSGALSESDARRFIDAARQIKRACRFGCSLPEVRAWLGILFPGDGWCVDQLDSAVHVSRRGGFVALFVEEVKS